jgi:CheY-like chemotaxis protein
MKKQYIIIVEDDADDREIIKHAFTGAIKDHEYVFLEDGEKLLDYLDNHQNDTKPALIILDLNMPGKDGKQILSELKKDERFRAIPIIILTTSSSERDKNASYTLGANCFITKPDTFDNMVQITNAISKLWLH